MSQRTILFSKVLAALWLLVASIARAASGTPASLAEAESALAQGNPEAAARWARQRVAGLRKGKATRVSHAPIWYLLGVAELRLGHHVAALQALDRAASLGGELDLGALDFSRGEALEGLGRPAEAMRAYYTAASANRNLQLLGTVSAANAAVDAREFKRAARLVATARSLDAKRSYAQILDDLEVQARYGLAPDPAQTDVLGSSPLVDPVRRAMMEGSDALSAGRFDESIRHFEQAAKLAPANGEPHLMAGLANLKAGNEAAASRSFHAALGSALTEDDRVLIKSFVQMLEAAKGPAKRTYTGYILLASSGGFDTNPSQVGLSRGEGLDLSGQYPNGSQFASAAIGLGLSRALGERLTTEWTYAFYQIGYSRSGFTAYSFQSHTIDWWNHVKLSNRWRASLALRGDISFSGWGPTFEPFQTGLAAEPHVIVRPTTWMSTRLQGVFAAKRALAPAYAVFGGARMDAQLTQEFRIRGWTLSLSGRRRYEQVGSRVEDPFTFVDAACTSTDPNGDLVFDECDFRTVTPFAYVGSSAAARIQSPFASWVRGAIALRLEDRQYAQASVVGLDPRVEGESRTFSRRDQRLTGSADMRLGRDTGVSLRYDVVLNRSNIDEKSASTCAPCHPLDFDNRNFIKHAVSLELDTSWWFL